MIGTEQLDKSFGFLGTRKDVKASINKQAVGHLGGLVCQVSVFHSGHDPRVLVSRSWLGSWLSDEHGIFEHARHEVVVCRMFGERWSIVRRYGYGE